MALTDFSNEIQGLKEAIASGATRVSYDGKSVDYDSFEKMLQRLGWLERQQATATGARRGPRAGFATFDRGDR